MVQACHMSQAARRDNHKLIVFTNGSTQLYDVFADPTESFPLTNTTAEAELTAMLSFYGEESVHALLPPLDAIVAGGR